VTDQDNAAKLKVFVSYSRHDSSELAQELVNGLKLLGFDPFLDRHNIAAAEDWEARLASLIQTADTVVFVISPEAVKSERCAWEVEKSIAMSKRLIPVVGKLVPEADVPPSLTRLNYIFFSAGHSFTTSLGQLADALKTDLGWIREHTRLGELAARWRERKEPDSLLLRGDDLEAAQAWLAARKAGAPEPTDAQRAFIAASADAEAARVNRERQQLDEMAKAQAARAEALGEREIIVKRMARRTTIGLIGAAVLTIAAASLAYWATQAEQRFNRERERAEEALRQSVDEAIRREAMRTDLTGQLSAYAAGPGQEAEDGPPGGNSPYTKQVLAELADDKTSLQAALARVRQKVIGMSSTGQRPYLSSDLNGEIYLQRHPPDRRRIAILVHMDRVPAGKLENVERDALAWRDFLETKGGFKTIVLKNPDRAAYRSAIAGIDFSAVEHHGRSGRPFLHNASVKLGPGPPRVFANTLLLFFYAGAGAYQRGANYLMANDADLSSLPNAPKTLMPLGEIQDELRYQAAASILVLDTNFMDIDRDTAPPAPTTPR
jgi:hypothetical protein